MPLNRTPTKTTTDSPLFGTPLQHYASDSNLTNSPLRELAAKTFANELTRAPKRKLDNIGRSEILDLFASLQESQEQKFSAILSSISDVKLAMDSMTNKYEEVIQRIDIIEEANKNYVAKIELLENKVEALERQSRGTSIEIRNIPLTAQESKEYLRSILKSAAETLSVPLDSTEIRDIYRTAVKSSSKPIVAEFTTVSKRDLFLTSLKKHNKLHSTDKLSTANLNLSGPKQPVFISESLTYKDKKLFFLAREFVKNSGYAFCWTSFGRIFIREKEGSPPLRISCEEDLNKLVK